MTLRGKTALVTGASGGFGEFLASILAGSGAEVIITARRIDALEASAARLAAEGHKVRTQVMDVRDSASIEKAFAATGPVDILVNNAGIVRSAAALDQTESDWDSVVDTNLKGAFLVAQAAARGMKAAGTGGSIVNVASVLGVRQIGGVLPYATSKAGLIQMTKLLALELARFGIRVNAIAPGYFATELNDEFWATDAGKALIGRIPQRRLGQLSDLEGPLMLLASDASRYITGAVVPIDGGHLVSGL